ncbi:zinc finger MYM-type protein 4-like isoform X3 [Silurus meridionalis]|nr:zinc finger MYM-type protein 4-like isoform X3 [Silurus meridionalis]
MEGRRRSGTDVASGMVSSPPSSKLHHMYGVKAWAIWVQQRAELTDASPLVLKEDVLDCSSEELGDALCHFISEVRRPNGQPYAPDSVYYLCLGIQQHLLENGRLENIFTDPLYNQFTTDMTRLIKDWEGNLTPSGFLQSRIEETFLWECKQLGALSPYVLLNTLIFFGVKHLDLKTVDQHQHLSFASIARCSRNMKHGRSSYLRFRFAGRDDGEREKRVLLGKRKRDDAEEDVEYGEMPENTEDPLHCPVRLYEFYLSKCPDCVKERPDVFYLQPESSCHPGSSVWYSTQPLDGTILDSMLSRILAVRDVHVEPKPLQPSSSDEDTP